MTKRIILDTDGLRVSRAGVDAGSATNVNLLIHTDMNPMMPIYSGQAVFAGNGNQTFTFPNNDSLTPVTVILRGDDGLLPHQNSTFYATTQAPFTSVKIHNVDGKARTVQFRVLR